MDPRKIPFVPQPAGSNFQKLITKKLLAFSLKFFLINLSVFIISVTVNAQSLMMETGSVSIDHTVTSVSLNNTFVDPVVIALPPSYAGTDQATVRLDNITGSGFDIFLEEANGLDGTHAFETVHYVVVEKGFYIFPNGTQLEAGSVSASNLSFQTVSLLQNYGARPAIFTQVQTDNSNTNFLKTRQRNGSASSFQVKLERAESVNSTSPSSAETIGYFAITRGVSDLNGLNIEANSFVTDESIHTETFSGTFSAGNHMVASSATYGGANPMCLRWTSLSNTALSLFVEEDVSNDAEVNHANETIDFFVIDDNSGNAIQSFPSPGGVAVDLALWLKSDQGANLTGSDVTSWDDQGPDSYDFTDFGANPYQYVTNSLNFNPTVDNPTGNNRRLANNTSIDLRTVIIVTVPANPGNNDGPFSERSVNNHALRVNPDDWRIPGGVNDFTTGGGLGWLNGLSGTNPSHNNSPNILSTQAAALATFSNGIELGDSQSSRFWHGDIAEIVAYPTTYSGDERERIESYLALKYGITLDQSSPVDYLASDGTALWDASNNTGYDSDIFGIGRDDMSALDQRVSQSVNTEAVLTIALDNDFTAANNDAGRTTTHTNDRQFLMIANNGSATDMQTSEVDATTYNGRTIREWKVDKTTNFTQNINLKFEGFGTNTNAIYYLLQDADGDFSAGATEVGALDANGEITGVSLSDGDYFTIATKQIAPGGVFNANIWLKANAGVTTAGSVVTNWEDQSQSSNTPTVVADPDLENNSVNFNPGVSLQGTSTVEYFDFGNLTSGWAEAQAFVVSFQDNEDITSSHETGLWRIGGNSNSHHVWTSELLFESFGNNNRINSITTPEGSHIPYFYSASQSASNQANLYWNGGNIHSSARNTHFPNEPVWLGRNRASNRFLGDVQEFILFDAVLSATDQQKINSYLAIKYGITLDQTSATDYLASDGTTIMWDASDNTGYDSDIFGIGRDTAQALDQRVATSVNTGAVLTIALDNDFTSVNTDAGRTTTHTNDKQFLMIANNGGATTFQSSEIDATTYNGRTIREWKVNKTVNFTQNINLKFEGFGTTSTAIYYLLQDTDGDFSAGATEVGQLDVNGEITGVSFNDGDYFTIATKQIAPGGEAGGLTFWLKANAFTTFPSNGGNVTLWEDQSVNGYDFTNIASSPYDDPLHAGHYAPTPPTYTTNYLNFNPAVNYDVATDDDMLTHIATSSLAPSNENATVYLVYTTSNNGNMVFSNPFGNSTYFYTRINTISASRGVTATSNASVASQLGNDAIFKFDRTVIDPTNTTINAYFNGLLEDSQSGAGHTDDRLSFVVGARGGSGPGATFDGHVSEFIMYAKGSPITHNKIESYLSIKYGITLDQTTPTDYLASDGSVIWDASDNVGYDNDIFGIGRDTLQALDQKVSRSVSDIILTIALDNDFTSDNNDAGRTTTHTNNKQFLMIANDGGASTLQATEVDATTYNARITREWKVDKTTNFGQSVNLKFEGFETTGTAEYFLLRDADGDFSAGAIEVGTLDANGEITGVSFSDGDYFTIAVKQVSPGGIVAGLALWLKANEGVTGGASITQWNDQSGNDFNFTNLAAGTEPATVANDLNFNPSISFDGTDDILEYTGGNIIPDVMQNNSTSNHAIYIVNQYNSGSTAITFLQEGVFSTLRPSFRSNGGYAIQTSSFISLNPTTANGDFGIREVTSTFGGNIQLYLNGANNGNTPITVNSGAALGNRTTIGGRDQGGSQSRINGKIAEIIAFSYNTESSTDRQQVESYLAIKYGITLDQTSAADYLASDGTVIWDASGNVGYDNDIFGIGRDTLQALDQRVSKSVNSGTILTIALDNDFTSANNDAGRTTTHTNNKQFLMVGNDGGATTTQTTEIDLSTYTGRISREWKVDKTANFGQVTNLKFDGFSTSTSTIYYLLADSDGDFSTGATEVGTLDANGEITGVNLTDGIYFTIVIKQFAPGGVTDDLVVWLKANDGLTISGTDVTGWDDQSANGYDFTDFGVNSYTYLPNGLNYNATINNPDGSNRRLARNESIDIRTVSIVVVPDNPDACDGPFGERNSDDENFRVCSGPGSNWHIPGNSADFTVGGQGWFNGASTTNPAHQNMPNLITGEATALRTVANGIELGDGMLNRFWHGDIGEVVCYSSVLAGNSRERVESYLALKYGITLDNTAGGTAGDYLLSDGSTIWDASDFPAYHNQIIGIVRDDESVLTQKQSKTYDDSLTLYIDNLSATNQGNTGTITNNLSSIIIGNDGAKLKSTPATIAEKPATITSRFDREWKVTNTNFTDDFSIEFEWDSIGTFNLSDIRLLVDDDGDFTDAAIINTPNVTFGIGSIIVSGISTTTIPMNSTRFITIGSVNVGTPLPIELTAFTTEAIDNRIVELEWETASEIDNDYFEIERSANGYIWETIAKVNGSGNSSASTLYSTVDKQPLTGTSYYRLKQTDFDGQFHYVATQSVTITDPTELLIYPNPTSNIINIKGSASELKTIRIYNALGQEITPLFNQIESTGTIIQIDLSKVQDGIYYLVTENTVNKIMKH